MSLISFGHDDDMAVGVLNLCHREDLDARLRGDGHDDMDEEEWQ